MYCKFFVISKSETYAMRNSSKVILVEKSLLDGIVLPMAFIIYNSLL